MSLNFPDGTSLVIEVEEDQGFYRRETYSTKEQKLIIHEIFISEGK